METIRSHTTSINPAPANTAQVEALRARVQELEAKVRRLEQMIAGATIECSGGGVTLTWGAD